MPNYFNSGAFTINFSSTGLYLVAYHVLSSPALTEATALWNTDGTTWFGDNQANVNTKVRPTTNTTTLSPTGTANTSFITSSATPIELTATGSPGNTLADPVGALSEYTGNLYAIVKVMTKNTAKFFTTLDSSVPTATLSINGVPASASTFYTNALTTKFRSAASGTGDFSGGFSSCTNVNLMGSTDIAQILFTFTGNVTQDQALLDSTDSIALTVTI